VRPCGMLETQTKKTKETGACSGVH
jgi:hypothetical protein